MKYLITGAGGYVGRHVVNALLDRNAKITVATRNPYIFKEEVEIFSGNILESSPNIFKETGSPDVLIHLAWEDGFVHSSSKHLENLPSHIQFIKNMFEGGLKQIVNIGTSHEVGFHVGPVDENTPTRPKHAYGIAKNHLRDVQLLLCEQYGVINQWVRCFYIYGDDAYNNSIFTKILDAERRGEKNFSLNSGELLYDFIHVEELGKMIADVAGQKEVDGIINCCSGDPVTLKTMVLNFIKDNKLNINPVWGEFPLRAYDSRALWGDAEKITKIRRLKYSA
ncbi:NAD(P)-dependent oxidoreductase [Pseudochrobactrum sp. AO18b]|uniref:NAD-dependent epimerase/dehydratase family protein n=1 Tax=Pseudochrobactrum sp. AO18b TaxID=1201036 RepID=UPI00039D6F8F|nr:NAD(P)-dependent oxidoreductase [Pseudochrobactrum sp. AO18b]